jgi:hypothetical protein
MRPHPGKDEPLGKSKAITSLTLVDRMQFEECFFRKLELMNPSVFAIAEFREQKRYDVPPCCEPAPSCLKNSIFYEMSAPWPTTLVSIAAGAGVELEDLLHLREEEIPWSLGGSASGSFEELRARIFLRKLRQPQSEQQQPEALNKLQQQQQQEQGPRIEIKKSINGCCVRCHVS